MLTIRDVMTRSVVTVDPGTPIKDVAQLLVDRRISGVPVVDDGTVVGVVSEADLLLKEQGPDAVEPRRFAWLLGEDAETLDRRAKIAATTAGEAMTRPPITVGPELAVAAAAARMTAHRVNRLPVLEFGQLIGIVTRADLVRTFVRSDEDLTDTIRNEVLRRIFWLDPSGFDVSVRDGVATIRGRTEQRSTSIALARAIAMVPGVVAVEPDLSWSLDDRAIEPVELDPVFPFGPR